MKTIRNYWYIHFLILLFLVLQTTTVKAQAKKLHVFDINNSTELKKFFKYSSDFIPFISAHRGGAAKGFPENCIQTFENTLSYVHSILEIDTRMSRDGEIVLMHDASINRTSTGSGLVSDFTLEELKSFKLTDIEGTPTLYAIPTFNEVLEWADGKTILVIDRKNVPLETIVEKIVEHDAFHRVVFMAYNFEEAKKYHALNEDAVMEVFVRDEAALKKLLETGIPVDNFVAFITHARPENSNIYSLINQRGMMNIIGTSRGIDKEYLEGNKDIYVQLIKEGCNIIEADLAIEAGLEIKHLRPEKSSKDRFFKVLCD